MNGEEEANENSSRFLDSSILAKTFTNFVAARDFYLLYF